MKNTTILLVLLALGFTVYGQRPEDSEDWSRKPVKVTPGEGTKPPSDATILYGGSGDLMNWEGDRGGPAPWKGEDVLTTVPEAGSIHTKQAFGDVQLHVEWRVPADVEGTGQDRGNSGIYLMGLYEVQVLDSYENETYYNGQAGSIYKEHIPLVNASLPPGQWQTYDIMFTAPRFKDNGVLEAPGYITVIHNGVLIQNHVTLFGPTDFYGPKPYKPHPAKLPLMLQDHDHPVSFRNIWIREF
ncbi:MAG: 3-keto-disaccharide hydrolase [Bacteroidales bacterium]